MQKQLETTHSQGKNKLTTSSAINTALILNEQPDKAAAITAITYKLERIVRLWQIPNFTAVNSVELAEWIYDTYKYDSTETILGCLQNPPIDEYMKQVDNPTWRLTPEVITIWMKIVLTKDAVKREEENQKKKESEKQVMAAPFYPEGSTEEQKREIWKAFYKEKFFDYQEARKDLDQKPKKWFQDPAYQEARNKYLASSKLQSELRNKREEIKKDESKKQ